jgi:hypothetical protein
MVMVRICDVTSDNFEVYTGGGVLVTRFVRKCKSLLCVMLPHVYRRQEGASFGFRTVLLSHVGGTGRM